MPTPVQAAIFGAPNLAAAGTLTSVTSEEANYPASNLLDADAPGERWHSTSLATQTIAGDLGAAYGVDSIAVVNHNLDGSGTWAVDLDGNSGFPSPELTFGDTAIHLTTYTTRLFDRLQPMAVKVWDTPQTIRYWRIVLKNASLAAGYMAAGCVVIGLSYRPWLNYPYEPGVEDQSKIQRTRGGRVFVDQRQALKTHRLTLARKAQNDAWPNLFGNLWVAHGKGGKLVVVPRPHETDFYHLEAGYYAIEGWDRLANVQSGTLFSGALELKEAR